MKEINEDKLQEKIDWEPFFEQETVIKEFDQKREVVLAAGRRGGKSMLAAYLALKQILYDDQHIWIVAPTYQLTEKVFNYVTKWAQQGFPNTPWDIKTRPFPQINTKWDSWIQGKTTNKKEGLLGEELDLVIVDEAARVSQEAWENYIYPALTSRNGKSIKISTPKGRNQFYNDWMRAKQRSDSFAYRYKSEDNPHVDDEEIERAKDTYPQDVFRQEFEARFLKGAATVFDPDILEDLIDDDAPSDYNRDHMYVIGVDLAKHEDYTVITVIDTRNNKVCYVEKLENEHYPYQKERIKAIAERYGNARITVDSTGVGEPIYDDLIDAGLVVDDFKFTNTSKRKLIDKLRIIFEEKNLVLPNNEELKDQLLSFSYDTTAHGNVQYSAPEGMHDDYVDSLALACWSLDNDPERREREFDKELRKQQKQRYSQKNKYV